MHDDIRLVKLLEGCTGIRDAEMAGWELLYGGLQSFADVDWQALRTAQEAKHEDIKLHVGARPGSNPPCPKHGIPCLMALGPKTHMFYKPRLI